MQLTTPVQVEPFPFQLPLGAPVYAVGSCFAERIGQKLAECLCPVVVNPLGTLYNPISLSRALRREESPAQLFLHQGLWRSLNHHGQLAASSVSEARARLGQARLEQSQALQRSRVLLLTLGTAQVFVSNRGQVVTNCHRLDQHLFRRRRLSPRECVQALLEPITLWLEDDPDRCAILSVSPIRYLRDGLVENSRGKATLLLACDELQQLHPRILYFPAFEIVLDELRDYRFYQQDLIAPSPLAVELIWERFVETVLDPDLKRALPLLNSLHQARQHRFGSDSDPRPLARRSLQRLEQLATAHPELDLSHHRGYFEGLLERPDREKREI